MKSLKIHAKESIFDDIEDIASSDNALIEQFLKDNYDIRGPYTIKDGVVDVKGHVYLRNSKAEALTNGLFQFGKVGGSFVCSCCKKLASLKGAPVKVPGEFQCYNCSKLKSLEGAPEKVKDIFWCSSCTNLKSLKGAPKKVGGYFWCDDCKNLTITDQDRKKYKIKD